MEHKKLFLKLTSGRRVLPVRDDALEAVFLVVFGHGKVG